MLCPCYFNSRPSARGDGPPAAEQALYAYFNSRPSARGDVQRRRNGKPVEDFNSRPSARGDAACSPLPLSSAISIHAPPRGATSAHTMRWSTALFQFTPLREGRRCGFSPIPPSAHFNSRPSARGDPTPAARRLPPSNFNSRPSARGISIHAPPRGATCWRFWASSPTRHFNSRPSARGDSKRSCWPCTASNFNSRPSARGDLFHRHVMPPSAQFQFTPLREGRPHEL